MRTAKFHSVITFARFCAELTREGIAFTSEERGDEFIVTMTGY